MALDNFGVPVNYPGHPKQNTPKGPLSIFAPPTEIAILDWPIYQVNKRGSESSVFL